MPQTTSHDAFKSLLDQIEPTQPEDRARLTHRGTIQQGISRAFNVDRVEIIGSHARGSAIRTLSDVDYLAVVSRDDVHRAGSPVASSTVLSNVRAALRDRFPRTEISIDGCAVVVSYGQGKGRVDVVPAFYQGALSSKDGYPSFAIPDGSGGWRATSPQRHGKFLAEADAEAGRKLFKVVRLLKAWKYARAAPLPCSGFHLELLLANERICAGARSYAPILRDVFRCVATRHGRPLRDPLGISGNIPAASTSLRCAALATAAAKAAEQADRAIALERAGRHNMALRVWNAVFNGSLPVPS